MAIITNAIRGEAVWTDLQQTSIASFPPECLPATSFTYYSSFAFSPATNPYANSGVLNLPTTAGLISWGVTAGGLALPMAAQQTWTTNHRHIFAQVQYRVNEPVILTEEMISSKKIRMPNYIYEMLCVTPEPIELPPKIQAIGDYTFNKAHLTSDYQIQVQLYWETPVTWTLSNPEFMWASSDFISISDKGVITVKPQSVSSVPQSTTVKVTATNSMGSHFLGAKFTFINDPEKPSVQVTTRPEDVKTESRERREDLLWQELSEKRTSISGNIFKKLVLNQDGISYRMDCPSNKSSSILGQTGLGTYTQPHYQDGSTREMEINSFGNKRAGDVVYITYVAVKEHFFRQCVHVKWYALDMGILGFVSYPTAVDGANYRFYTWKVSGIKGIDAPNGSTELSGWRIVESFNYKPETIAVINRNRSAEVGYFNYDSSFQTQYLPGKTDINDISDPSSIVSGDFAYNNQVDSQRYQLIDGKIRALAPSDYQNSWLYSYARSNSDLGYTNQIQYLVYNTHPVTMVSRDIDKKGYPSSLALALQDAIQQNKPTYLPFMDVRERPPVSKDFPSYSSDLDNTNFKTEPINSAPQILNTANAVSISSPIGLFPRVGSGWVYGEFASNLIREPLKKGTKILVENKPLGSRGSIVLSINCRGGGEGYLSTTFDKAYQNAFIFTSNSENFLIRRHIRNDSYYTEVNSVDFRPDLGGIEYTNLTTDVSKDAYPVVGFAGLLGDSSGTYPGRAVSFYKHAKAESFVEYYTMTAKTEIPTQKKIAAALISGGDILISLGEYVYTGSLTMTLNFSSDFDLNNYPTEALVIFANGNNIESAIDRVFVASPANNRKITIELNDYFWLKGDSIRVKMGTLNNLSSIDVNIVGLKPEYCVDFYDKKANPVLLTPEFSSWSGGNFIETSYATAHTDERGVVYSLFQDKANGISCVYTEDEGMNWNLQYSLLPAIDDQQMKYPFLFRSQKADRMYLLFVRKGILYISHIETADINTEDNFKIEESFIGGVKNSYAYVAGGLNTEDNFTFIQNNERYRLGTETNIHNDAIDTPYFSAYCDNDGEMRIMFLDPKNRVQCHYSSDDGVNWTDLWVCMKDGTEGLLKLAESYGKPTEYEYGLNPHPQIVKTTEPISSPYAFFNPINNSVYLFYVYKSCLLCRTFENPFPCDTISGRNSFDELTTFMETTPVIFVDGNSSQIEDELDKNITMVYAFARGKFDDTRAVQPQRIHAVQLPDGSIRVYYKVENAIRCAVNNADIWSIEDMSHVPEEQ